MGALAVALAVALWLLHCDGFALAPLSLSLCCPPACAPQAALPQAGLPLLHIILRVGDEHCRSGPDLGFACAAVADFGLLQCLNESLL